LIERIRKDRLRENLNGGGNRPTGGQGEEIQEDRVRKKNEERGGKRRISDDGTLIIKAVDDVG